MADEYNVQGLTDLTQKLSKLPARIEKNILRSMVRAGAQVVRKAAQNNLPANVTDTKILLKPSRSKSRRGRIVMEVGPPKDKWYLKFFESGTKPHVIKTDRKKILSTGEEVFGVEIQHPGQAAEPFLRPALDENEQRVIDAMRKQGEKRVEKEAAKR